MKNMLLILVTVLIAMPAMTQSKSKAQQKDEKTFLQQLNALLQHGKAQHHWALTDTYRVEKPFSIEDAVLNVTLRYKTDTSFKF